MSDISMKTKSRTQEIAEFIIQARDWVSVKDLEAALGFSNYEANNALFSIKKSGRYETVEKKVGKRTSIKVLKINKSKHISAQCWQYTRQEEQERIKWDFAIFGIEPVRNKAFELELS